MKKIKPLIIFILLLLGMALFPYVPLYILHIDIQKLSATVKVIYNFGCDLVFMILVFFLYRKVIIRDFKNYFKDFGKNFETSFKYYLVGFIIMIISNLVITFFFKDAAAGNEDAIRQLIGKYPVYMIFSVSLYAPFIEELIFRKSIKDIFKELGNNKLVKYLYIATSGFIFAALHIVGMTTSLVDYLFIIPYLALGCAFAALYYRTDNIFSTIMMHALHNTFAVILYLVVGVV